VQVLILNADFGLHFIILILIRLSKSSSTNNYKNLVSVFLNGIYIAYMDINIIAGEKFFNELAEGATTPETLRQKDCNNRNTIWRAVLNL